MMLAPAMTGSGVSVLVRERSACVVTVVVAVAELLPGTGSGSVVLAVAVFVIMLPFGVDALTLTTIVKTAVAPLAILGFENVTVPVPPTGGVRELNPAGGVAETKVVPAGTASDNT